MYKLGQVTEYQYNLFTRQYNFNNASSKATLQVPYRPMGDTVKDCALSMINGGFINGRPTDKEARKC